MSRAPDLELGVIGNCEVAALIDRHGAMVWACLPRLDGDPAFNALLTPDGGESETGVFAIDLQGVAQTTQSYERNTAILQTVLSDSQGNVVRITDFCPRFRARGRMFRPMSFIRLVEPRAGRPIVRVRLRPSYGYGTGLAERHPGSHHICFLGSGLRWRTTTNASLAYVNESSWFVLDDALAFVLGPDETLGDAPLAIARDFLGATSEYWHDWVRGLAIPVEWQEAVIRAAITLKLCTYEDTGAVVAALTTSIPEHAGSTRNWDYRYCWLRDSYFVVQALNRLGATRTMEGFLRYISNVALRSANGRLQPLYGIAGDTQILESVAPGLPGYRGMGPVRVGNLAYLQQQNDVYGAVVLAAAQFFFDQRLTSPGDLEAFKRLERAGARAAEVFLEADSGPGSSAEWRARTRFPPRSAGPAATGCTASRPCSACPIERPNGASARPRCARRS